MLFNRSPGTDTMLRFFLVLLLLIPSILQSQDKDSPTDEVLTIDQAIALALQHNRTLENARLSVDEYVEKYAAFRTFRFPSITFNALGSQLLTPFNFTMEQGILGTYPVIGPIPAEDTVISSSKGFTAILTASVSQPISQQYRIGLNLKQIKTQQQISEEDARLQQQTTVFDVRQAYYQVVQIQSSLEAAKEMIAYYRELDRTTDNYVQQQTALKVQSLQVKAGLANSEYQALQLEDGLASQKEMLNDLIGRDIRTEFDVTPTPDAAGPETELSTAQSMALSQRPEIKQAQLAVTAAEYGRRAKKAEYIPSLSLNYSYAAPVNFSDFIPEAFSSIGFYLSWDIYDWGRKSHELAERTLQVKEAENNLQEAQSQVLMDVNNKFRKLKEAREFLRVSQLSQAANRENVRVIMNEYQQQTALLDDVLEAQSSLAQANAQYQQALSTFWTASAAFQKALGGD